MKLKLMTAVCILWLTGAAFAANVTARWKVEDIRLEPRTELVEGIPFNIADLTINIADMQRRISFTLSAEAVLSDVRDTILYRDKLAVYGIAGNTAAVVIFDLARREETDWFYCSRAKQVFPGKLIIAMWAPAHFVILDPVLTLYDMAKTPSANRLKVAQNTHFPLPVDAQGEGVISVGVPIYPEKNVGEGSYDATEREPGEAGLSADLDTAVALTPERLVLVAGWGVTTRDEVTWLEVVNIPHSDTNAKSERVDIPVEQIHVNPEWVKQHRPFNPKWIPISTIEAISPTEIRLHFPEEYCADTLEVQIPDL